MASKFKALSFDLIDEGTFQPKMEADLRKLQQDMVAYARKHGEKAKKAKGELIIKVKVSIVDPLDGAYTIVADTKSNLPSTPPSVTMALAEEDENGTGLFVRASGSSGSTPKQGKLCTDDGRPIDPVTGEVK